MHTTELPSQQQNPTQNQSQASSSKNLKNWFDEFKAKVSKKSQSNQPVVGDILLSSQADDKTIKTTKECSNTLPTKPKNSSLRLRKVGKILATDDLETSAIQTSSRKQDRRVKSSKTNTGKTPKKLIKSKFFDSLRCVILYLIPFNYTLPWKLICVMNTSFMIAVIGLASGSTDATTVLSFANGFVCGLAAACISFMLLTISVVLHILPKSQNENLSISQSGQQFKNIMQQDEDSSTLNDVIKENLDCEQEASLDCTDLRDGDFSLIEILDEDQNQLTTEYGVEQIRRKLDDGNYKGWMIEFIGDYEMRNSSDIKLKSIFVKIEDRVLHLCKPKSNHDTESSATPVFIGQRTYDLNNVKKLCANLLLPKNVRNKQKYVWSKKYPIRLEFHIEECNDSSENKTVSEDLKHVRLTLFARSCREKEEWFRKFKRIAETIRFGQGQGAKRSSSRSEESPSFVDEGHSESLLGTFRRFKCRSPSPKRDFVQTSQSSHLLSEPKKTSDDEGKPFDMKEVPQSPILIRTKSCELLHPGESFVDTDYDQEKTNEETSCAGAVADDSTLTRETADLFSQAIDYSNYIDSQPTLDYKDYIERLIFQGKDATPSSDWFNALTGRIFFDVFSHNYWSVWFKRKIQRKLYRIRLPYFMETLTLTKIDLGTNAPQFLNVASHTFDSSGLSIDFDMTYSGGLTMTFETKLNLLKIKTDNSTTNVSANSNSTPHTNPTPAQQQQNQNQNLNHQQSNQQQHQQQQQQPVEANSSLTRETSCENLTSKESKKPSLSVSTSTPTSCESTSDSEDSNSDSSSDSSFDEAELNEISDWEDYGAEKTRQNIVKFVDKIASSRYFQHATENRYIKKKLKDISNCPLVLVVQIQSLNGLLTLNVPPPHTNRLWYGFKPMPELTLKAIPKMGDREVNLSHVTDWIERKLAEEFRRLLVIPNMEDIVLPVLKSDHMQYITETR